MYIIRIELKITNIIYNYIKFSQASTEEKCAKRNALQSNLK